MHDIAKKYLIQIFFSNPNPESVFDENSTDK